MSGRSRPVSNSSISRRARPWQSGFSASAYNVQEMALAVVSWPWCRGERKSIKVSTNIYRSRPVASQPGGGGGGSELGWVEHQAHPPPLDIVRVTSSIWKTPPLLGIHRPPPPPLDIARVTSSTYSKGGTKLLKGETKLLKGGTKLLKGGTKSLGWAIGGVVRPPDPPPPWLRAWCRYISGVALSKENPKVCTSLSIISEVLICLMVL